MAAQRDAADKKPSLSLKASPPAGFAPLRVHLTVDVRGGANDYADFYCPTVQWDWDDGTISETSEDCNPYEAGKSNIQRRYSANHARTFRLSGDYRVSFRLKQKDKVVSSAAATLTVRPGATEGSGEWESSILGTDRRLNQVMAELQERVRERVRAGSGPPRRLERARRPCRLRRDRRDAARRNEPQSARRAPATGASRRSVDVAARDRHQVPDASRQRWRDRSCSSSGGC